MWVVRRPDSELGRFARLRAWSLVYLATNTVFLRVYHESRTPPVSRGLLRTRLALSECGKLGLSSRTDCGWVGRVAAQHDGRTSVLRIFDGEGAPRPSELGCRNGGARLFGQTCHNLRWRRTSSCRRYRTRSARARCGRSNCRNNPWAEQSLRTLVCRASSSCSCRW